eukprot:1155599-Pelagomonas_calceolata.AAC.7
MPATVLAHATHLGKASWIATVVVAHATHLGRASWMVTGVASGSSHSPMTVMLGMPSSVALHGCRGCASHWLRGLMPSSINYTAAGCLSLWLRGPLSPPASIMAATNRFSTTFYKDALEVTRGHIWALKARRVFPCRDGYRQESLAV